MENTYENKTLWIKCEDMDNLDFPLTSENFFKMICVESGVLQISTASESFELFEGDTWLFFPSELHSALTYEKNHCKILTFSRDICSDFDSFVSGKVQVSPIFKIGTDIDYLESIGDTCDYFLNKSSLYAILSCFLQRVQLRNAENSDSGFIFEVSKYIRENFTSEITLEGLSAHLGYGYNYTSALFKKHFKCNFMFFVNQYRIALSEKLLQDPKLSITDIAFECGFNSLRSFGRNFQLHKGMSPKEWRKAELFT